MLTSFLDFYSWLFARPQFRSIHEAIVKIGLKGLGILYSHDHLRNGELNFLKKIIEEYKISSIFDVGANTGNYAKICFDLGFNGSYLCFEPHHLTFQKLTANLTARKVQTFNIGLSNFDGEATIYDHGDQDGSEHASLFKDVIQVIHKDKVTKHVIALRTLDSFSNEFNVERIGLLKIDTEGNEYNVLVGAKEMLCSNRIDIIHFEFNDMNTISKVFMRDFMDILPNYNIYRLLPKGLLKLDYSKPLLVELFTYQNIVAIRKGVDKGSK